MTDSIRVKNTITGVVAELPAHYLDIPALFEPWELTEDEAYCTDCEIPAPEVPIFVPTDTEEPPAPTYRKARK